MVIILLLIVIVIVIVMEIRVSLIVIVLEIRVVRLFIKKIVNRLINNNKKLLMDSMILLIHLKLVTITIIVAI